MGRSLATIAAIGATAALLAGCGLADSQALYVPAVLRAEAPPARQPDPEPDVKQLLRDNLASVFARGAPKNLQVAPPRRNPNGLGWTACLRASVTSITGRPGGQQTYLVSIERGAIGDRRLVTPDDNCASERYEPV